MAIDRCDHEGHRPAAVEFAATGDLGSLAIDIELGDLGRAETKPGLGNLDGDAAPEFPGLLRKASLHLKPDRHFLGFEPGNRAGPDPEPARPTDRSGLRARRHWRRGRGRRRSHGGNRDPDRVGAGATHLVDDRHDDLIGPRSGIQIGGRAGAGSGTFGDGARTGRQLPIDGAGMGIVDVQIGEVGAQRHRRADRDRGAVGRSGDLDRREGVVSCGRRARLNGDGGSTSLSRCQGRLGARTTGRQAKDHPSNQGRPNRHMTSANRARTLPNIATRLTLARGGIRRNSQKSAGCRTLGR